MTKINIEKKIKEFVKALENEKDVMVISIKIGREDGITISYDWDNIYEEENKED